MIRTQTLVCRWMSTNYILVGADEAGMAGARPEVWVKTTRPNRSEASNIHLRLEPCRRSRLLPPPYWIDCLLIIHFAQSCLGPTKHPSWAEKKRQNGFSPIRGLRLEQQRMLADLGEVKSFTARASQLHSCPGPLIVLVPSLLAPNVVTSLAILMPSSTVDALQAAQRNVDTSKCGEQ